MRTAVPKMAFIFVLLTGCATSKSGTAGENALTGKKWQWIEIRGRSVAEKTNNSRPYLDLSASDKKYVASGGCNGIRGSYSLGKGNSIAFSQGISTLMACPDMDTEQQMKSVLEDVRSYTLNGKVLTLQSGQGETIAKLKAT